jgi:hypothetical protein
MTIDVALAWSMFATLVVLVFAAGGAWVRLGSVAKLDTDLRAHMKDEANQWLTHLREGHHGND